MGDKTKLATLLLRIGFAIIFTYAATDSFLHPNDWVGFLPKILLQFLPGLLLLKFFAVYEYVLAAWILSGKSTKYAASLAALTLSGIVVTNFNLFIISFRDVALIFAAVALAVLSW